MAKSEYEWLGAIFVDAPEVADPGLRLLLLTKVAGVTYTQIERETGLAERSISAYVGGRSYAFPKLKRCVSEYLAQALDADVPDVRQYLFGPCRQNEERAAMSQPSQIYSPGTGKHVESSASEREHPSAA
jgi:hypothetical protein